MTETTDDWGLLALLRVAAWIFGLVVLGSLVRLLTYAGDGTSVQTELFVWVLLGSMSATFSMGCAVVLALKSSGPEKA